jgi:acyl-CoA synthetase (AMP-forming)/AMP-acid ligase II
MAIKKAYDTEQQGKTTAIEESRPALKLLRIPPLADLLLSRGEYPIRKRFESVEDETAFIIHSSGTTGLYCPAKQADSE